MKSLLVLFVSLSFTANAYKSFHGLSYEERTKCVGDNARCALDKSQLDVIVVGDTGGISFDLSHEIGTYMSTKLQRRLAVSMAQFSEENPVDFFLTLGDNIYWNGVDDSCDKRFETLFEEPYLDGRLLKPWYMIAGNHDHLGNIQAQIEYSQNKGKWTFPSLYYKSSYSINGGRTRADFIFVDSILMCGVTVDPNSRSFASWLWEVVANRKSLTGPKPGYEEEDRKQMRWLEKQLNESTADYIFVSSHYPIHSVASHGPTHCLQNKLDPLLRKYNVSAYFAGHDHALEYFREEKLDNNGRNTTMHYVVSGIGSRLDISDEHLNEETSRILLYRYPTSSDIHWLKRTMRTHLLGRGHGGFVNLVVKANEAELIFHASKDAPETYRASIPPRKRQT
ncbi:Tartrate-resistant acid phosphatase type 5 [Aphelenchoides bicaudatus]|nr:Tartrate-resistant acid phosphatase type 5 [Aphelenchoides bicaudatus]